MAQILGKREPQQKPKAPAFADQKQSMRQYAEGYARLNPRATSQEISQRVRENFGLSPEDLGRTGLTIDDPIVSAGEARNIEYAQEGLGPALVEGITDVAEVPASLVGFAGGVTAGAIEHGLLDPAAAFKTGLTGAPVTGFSGLHYAEEYNRLRADYSTGWRAEAVQQMTAAGVPEEQISHLLQLDDKYLREVEAEPPEQFRSIIPASKYRNNYEIEKTPLYQAVNSMMGGTFEYREAIDDSIWKTSQDRLRRMSDMRTEIEYGKKNRVLGQIAQINDSVQDIKKRDESVFIDLAADWDEMRNGSLHLLLGLMGGTEFEPQYREMASSGFLGRMGARIGQSFEAGRDFSAAIPAAYASLYEKDLDMVRSKPLLSFVLMLPVLKAASTSPAGLAARRGLSEVTLSKVNDLMARAKTDPHLAKAIERAEGFWNSEIPGLERKVKVEKGLEAGQREYFEGRAPYRVSDLGAAALKGAGHGLLFATPLEGAAVGTVLSPALARYRARIPYGTEEQAGAASKRASEAGQTVSPLLRALLAESERRAKDGEGEVTLPIGETPVGVERIQGRARLGSARGDITREQRRAAPLAEADAWDIQEEGRLREEGPTTRATEGAEAGQEVAIEYLPEATELGEAKPDLTVEELQTALREREIDVPVLDEGQAAVRLDQQRAETREILGVELENLIDEMTDGDPARRRAAIHEVGISELSGDALAGIGEQHLAEIPDAQLNAVISDYTGAPEVGTSYLKADFLDMMDTSEIYAGVIESRLNRVFRENAESGFKLAIDDQGKLSFVPNAFMEAMKVLNPAVNKVAAKLGIHPAEILKDLRFDGSIVKGSQLDALVTEGLRGTRSWEMLPTKTDLTKKKKEPPATGDFGSAVQSQSDIGGALELEQVGKTGRGEHGPVVQPPAHEPRVRTKGVTIAKERYRQATKGLKKKPAFYQPFGPNNELPNVNWKTEQPVTKVVGNALRKGVLEASAEGVSDIAQVGADLRVVHVKKKTTFSDAGIGGKDVTLDRGYVVYDAKTQSLVPNVLVKGVPEVRSVGKPKGFDGTAREYAAGEFLKVLSGHQRSVASALVTKNEAGLRAPSPPKGGKAAPTSKKAKKKAAREAAAKKKAEAKKTLEEKQEGMSEEEKSFSLADEDAKVRKKGNRRAQGRWSQIGGAELRGGLSYFADILKKKRKRKGKAAGDKGKKGAKGRGEKKKRGPWTTGDSEYSWNTRRSTGASGNPGPMKQFGTQMDAGWMYVGNMDWATPAQIKRVKTDLINQTRGLDRRARSDIGNAIKGYTELLSDVRAAISDSTSASTLKTTKRWTKEIGTEPWTPREIQDTLVKLSGTADLPEPRVAGAKDPYKLQVSTRLAQTLRLNDLVGLEQMLVAQRKSLINRAIGSKKKNPYSLAKVSIKTSPWYRAMTKVPADVLLDMITAIENKVDLQFEQPSNLNNHAGRFVSVPRTAIPEVKFAAQVDRQVALSLLNELRNRKELKPQLNLFRQTKSAQRMVKRGIPGWVKQHGKPLTDAQLKARLAKMTAEELGQAITREDAVTAFQKSFPITEGAARLADTAEGSRLVVGKDGVTRLEQPTTFKVSRFLRGTLNKVSRTLERQSGFLNGSKDLMAQQIRSIFKEGYGLLTSPILRGVAKQEALRRLRSELKRRKITFSEQDMINIEGPLNEYFESFNRPFYAEGEAGVVNNLMRRVPDEFVVEAGQGVEIVLDMADVFDSALDSIKESKDPKLALDAVTQDAIMATTKLLADDARKGAHFRALSDEVTRIGITEDMIQGLADAIEERGTELGEKAFETAMEPIAQNFIESVWGRFENPPNGMPMSPQLIREFSHYLRDNPKKILKWVESERKMTGPQVKQFMGGRNVTRIPAGTQMGRMLSWIDTWDDVGAARQSKLASLTSAMGDFLSKYRRVPNEKKGPPEVALELKKMQEQLFGEDSFFRNDEKMKFESDFSVSPEWNEGVWWEVATRMGMSEFFTVLGTNSGAFRRGLLKAHRYTKASMTTMNPATHIGNTMSNVLLVSLMTGESPFAASRRTVATTYNYLKYMEARRTNNTAIMNKMKASDPAQVRIFEVLDRHGFEMQGIVFNELQTFAEGMGDPKLAQRIKVEFGELGKEPSGAAAAKARKAMWALPRFFLHPEGAARKTGKWLYNMEDVSFRISEFVREYSELEQAVDLLQPGKELYLETGTNRSLRIERTKDGQISMFKQKKDKETGRTKRVLEKMTKTEVQNRVAAAAMTKVNRVIFNYSDIPTWLKVMRDIPFSPLISPFITWAYKALDIPGIKRGLVSDTLFERPTFLTNDLQLQAWANRRSVARSARRSGYFAGATSEMNEQTNFLAQHGRYSKELGGYGAAIAEIGERWDILNLYRTGNMDPYSRTMSYLKVASTIPTAIASFASKNLPWMAEMAPKFMTKQEMKDADISMQDKHVQLLRKAYATGNGLNRREVLNLMYLGTTPAMGMMKMILLGQSPYHDGPATAGDWVKSISQVTMGEGLYRLFGGAITLAFNPGLDDPKLSEVFPDYERFAKTRQKAAEGAPRSQVTQVDEYNTVGHIAGNALVWYLDYVLSFSRKEVLYSERGQQTVDSMMEAAKKLILDPLKEEMDALPKEEREEKRKELVHTQKVVEEWVQDRKETYKGPAGKMQELQFQQNRARRRAKLTGKDSAGQ